MRSQSARYRVEAAEPGDRSSEWFDTADDAMRAVNRHRALRAGDFVIVDEADIVLTDRQLAMIVMEERLVAARAMAPRA